MKRGPALASGRRRRAGRWLLWLLLLLWMGQAAGAPEPAGAATGTAPGAGPAGLRYDGVHVVVRQNPEGDRLDALLLVQARNTGSETLARVPLPWPEGAELVAVREAPAPAVEDDGLYDERPLPPGTQRRYGYQIRIDSRQTGGRILLFPPAPIERFYVLTRDGELVARSDLLSEGGTVDGREMGAPGVRLRLYQGGPLPAGTVLQVALLPPGMPAGPGEEGLRAGRAVPGALWAGGLVVAAGGALLVLAARRRRAGPAELRRRRRELIRQIVDLDRAHAAGEIEPEVYAEERERLRQAAITLTLELWEGAGAGTPSPAGGAGGDDAPSRTGRGASAP
ncbi:MAG: hypothetical protein DIU69_09090 [Bacillota bacterium]|nr:MAG: hypothetical protein DIU69_09090 [Bacillota bacterium]